MKKSVGRLVFFLVICGFPSNSVSRRHGRHHHTDGDRIVGGNETNIEKYPHQAYLLLQKADGYYQCGGSVISAQYVLTAAHCLVGVLKVIVRLGSTQASSGGTQYTSERHRSHPKYNPVTLDYDVGLVRLLKKINLDGVNTKVIKLADTGSSVAPGTTLTITGWGDTSENGEVSETLREVDIPTVSKEECSKSYKTITDRMICAGVPEGGKDSCQGDSGGPAITKSPLTQVGIVSFGVGCARPGLPGVYTNVASVREWIKQNAGI